MASSARARSRLAAGRGQERFPAVAVDAEGHQIHAPQGDLGVDGARLGHIADLRAAPLGGRPQHGERPGQRGEQPEEEAQEGRLPGPVGSEHGHELAVGHREVCPGPNGSPGVPGGQPAGVDGRPGTDVGRRRRQGGALGSHRARSTGQRGVTDPGPRR